MKLSNEQIQQYKKDGFLLLPNVFSHTEVENMQSELNALMSTDSPDIAYESDNKTIRAVHGCHLRSQLFDRLIKQARIMHPTMQLLSEKDVYLHQFKANVKKAFKGETWPWHQDFVYWHMGDGVPTPRNLTAIVYLDDITEFNAPVFFIPGSQAEGSINLQQPANLKSSGADWKVNFSTTPNYVIEQHQVEALIEQYGLVSAKGPAGSVVFFDSNVIHASSQNISPFHRRMLFLAYNSIDNAPPVDEIGHRRPEFLASRNYQSLSTEIKDTL